jgi:hypothetical protein
MGAGPDPRRSAPTPSRASAQPVGRAGRRLYRSRLPLGPRLSNRRGSARSGLASVGARLQGPPRRLALRASRGPIRLRPAATPSAGPARSIGQLPGRTEGHQWFLVRPPGDPVRLLGQRRDRRSSGRGQPLGSWRQHVPERVLTQPHRTAPPRPDDRQVLQPDPAALPAGCSTLPPWAASRSPDPGRHRPSRLRSTPGREVPGWLAQVLFPCGLARSSVIRQVGQTDPARRALQHPAPRRHVGPRPQLAHQAVTLQRRWPGRRSASRRGRSRPLQATPPQPPVPWRRARRRHRRNVPPRSVPEGWAVHPARGRPVGNHAELPPPMAVPPLPDETVCRRGVQHSTALTGCRCTDRDPTRSRTTPPRRQPADWKDRAAQVHRRRAPWNPSTPNSDPQRQRASSNPSPRPSGPRLQHAGRNPSPLASGPRPQQCHRNLSPSGSGRRPQPPRRTPPAPDSDRDRQRPRSTPPPPRHRTPTLQSMLAARRRRRRSRRMWRLGDRHPVPRRR